MVVQVSISSTKRLQQEACEFEVALAEVRHGLTEQEAPTPYVTKDDLELLTPLPLLPEY